MAKLKIQLKQHTPLIHFQSEQPGAILRATEVKPKLDKFLKKYAFPGGFKEYKQYLIGYKTNKKDKIEDFGDKQAFDYKLRITNVKNRKEEDIENVNGKKIKDPYYPNYFGNMGKDKKENVKKNKFVFCHSLNLEIISFNKNLLVKIVENLPLFLMENNFGQRQSKGFGSFFINDENRYYIDEKECFYENNKINSVKKSIYSFSSDDNSINKNIKKQINAREELYKEAFTVFYQIEKLYTRMRSGGQTENSYIKEFFKSKDIIWDKEAIRDSFVNGIDDVPKNAYLIKDLLGLSVDEIWKDRNKKDFNVKKEYKGNGEDKIERIKSPILFKPIKDEQGNFRIYVRAKSIPKEFFDKTFRIMKCVGKTNKEMVAKEIELTTPKYEEFSVEKFLKFVKYKETANRRKKYAYGKSNYNKDNMKNSNSKQKESSFSIDTKELNKLEEIKKKLKENESGEISDAK
ncbi:hypothetical protein [Clostridium botulinum]|uniref:hypothetical protein n=1 Tax=Clostridium botulinum TaxID=1491 RepID=UPI000A177CB2|nr:hypothetical protein [Clostridium botulinum]OSA97853.1 hypothetical protein B2H85_15740 [Clostridium botulinum]